MNLHDRETESVIREHYNPYRVFNFSALLPEILVIRVIVKKILKLI